MVTKRIYLKEKENIYIDAYIDGTGKDALLIMPGGGYSQVCADREGHPIAKAFLEKGFNCFVLHYSVFTENREKFPAQLIEASLAVKHIKDNAEEYGIKKDRVFALGFSAGGHLAACLGTMWHKEELFQGTGIPYGYNKPMGVMLMYPVICASGDFIHKPSVRCLLDTNTPTDEEIHLISVERHVDEKSCPLFVGHTSNDELVSVKNSLALVEAYANAGLTFEYHVWPDAPHGVALATKETSCGNEKWENEQIAKWVDDASFWAEHII